MGDVTFDFGPDDGVIPLKLKENSSNEYEGNYQGEWHEQTSGTCVGNASYPVSIDASAVENKGEGDSGTLDFTLKTDMGAHNIGECSGGESINVTIPDQTSTSTFTLPIKDGAIKTIGSEMATLTYTLRVGQ